MTLNYTLDGTKILIASMHMKQRAIIPTVNTYFKDIDWTVSEKLDTDQFWTFSGEVKRPKDMMGTLSLKIAAAFALYPEHFIAMWTEWSFTSVFPGIVRHSELIMVIDKRYWYTFSINYTSLLSWLWSYCSDDWDEMKEYIIWSFRFPEEWCMIQPEIGGFWWWWLIKKNNHRWITKGITDLEVAKKAFFDAYKVSKTKKVIVEPDFRALFCPKRMNNISAGVQQLIQQIHTICPDCGTHWWSKKWTSWSALCHNCWSWTIYSTHEMRWCITCAYEESKVIDTTLFPLDSCSICNP